MFADVKICKLLKARLCSMYMANGSWSGFYASLWLFSRHHYIIPGCLLCRMNGGDDGLNDIIFGGKCHLVLGKVISWEQKNHDQVSKMCTSQPNIKELE